jgi:O-antigen ligase
MFVKYSMHFVRPAGLWYYGMTVTDETNRRPALASPSLFGFSVGPGWLLVLNTILAALLWGSALFALLGQGPRWLSAHPAPGDIVGAPAIRPDLGGAPGVNLDASELAAPDLPARLHTLAGAGVRWVRFCLPWDQIQPRPGSYQWAAWDRVFAALAAEPALQPLVVLNRSPAWARPPEDAANPLAPPQTRADFGAFVAAAAQRYGTQVRYYQVWDEPNIAPHWGARPVDPAGYLGLLREAAVNVRQAEPEAQVVLAALAPNQEGGGANESDVDYLDALYGLGARAWFDIAAGEPYGFSLPPDAPSSPGLLDFGRAALLRQVMVRHGDAGTPLWATSFGWNALPPKWSGAASPWGQVSETEQARYAASAMDEARTRWPWLGPLFWAADCPLRPAGDPWRGFALCGYDDGAASAGWRPVWDALAAPAANPVLPPGEHAPSHPALHYSPGWRVAAGGADPRADGDQLDFTFYGTDLALRLQGGPYWAYYTITVDDRPANVLPRDEAGAAYLVLDDPLAETRVQAVARGLPLGDHRVALTATGGWDQWALRAIIVTAEQTPLLPWPVWAGLAALATASWAGLAWPRRKIALKMFASAGQLVSRQGEALIWGSAICCGLLLIVAPWPAVTLPLLAVLGALFLLRPSLMLPLIAASIPFWPMPRTVLRWQFSAFELLTWLGCLAVGARWLLPRLTSRRTEAEDSEHGPLAGPPTTTADRSGAVTSGAWSKASGRVARYVGRAGLSGLDWPVLALLGAAVASTAAAEHAAVALRELRSVFLDGALFYFLITRVSGWQVRQATAPDRYFEPLLPLIDGAIVGMVMVSGLALWQLFTGIGRIDVEGVWRVRALYGSPNNLALVLGRVLPLALALAFFLPASRVRRWLYAAAAALMAFVAIATFSKGAWLLGLPAGIGLVAVVGTWRSRRRWPLLVLGACAAGSAVALWALFKTPRFADLTNFEAGTSFIRLKLWQGAWHMALDHPWLGVGPDNFLYAYRTRYVLPSAWEELNLSHPHNILLDLWTRLGILGLVAGGWALLAAFRLAARLVRCSDRYAWPLALGLLGGLAATVLHGLIDNSLFLVDLMALFMLALGLLEILRQRPA